MRLLGWGRHSRSPGPRPPVPALHLWLPWELAGRFLLGHFVGGTYCFLGSHAIFKQHQLSESSLNTEMHNMCYNKASYRSRGGGTTTRPSSVIFLSISDRCPDVVCHGSSISATLSAFASCSSGWYLEYGTYLESKWKWEILCFHKYKTCHQ